MNARGRGNIPSLDGIRAVSIVLVMIGHYSKDVGWGNPLNLDSLGVRVFFVISGYLITTLLLKDLQKNGEISLPRFYFRRTLRIFPAFYFYIVCILLFSAAGWTRLSVREALPALTYTSNYFSDLQGTIKHTWSLATEEQFYLIWPLVVNIGGLAAAPYLLIALLTIAPISGYILTSLTHQHVPAFFNGPIGIGCLLALTAGTLHRSAMYRYWLRSYGGVLLPVIILASNLPILHTGGIRDEFFSLVTNCCIAFELDWTIANAGAPGCRWLNNAAVVYIGVLSYSIYLWQQPFAGLHGTDRTLLLRGRWQALANPVLRVAAIAMCTAVSYFCVERPFLQVRTWLEPKLFTQKKKPSWSGSKGIFEVEANLS